MLAILGSWPRHEGPMRRNGDSLRPLDICEQAEFFDEKNKQRERFISEHLKLLKRRR